MLKNDVAGRRTRPGSATLRGRLAGIAFVALSVALLAVAAVCVMYPPLCVWRVSAWQEADVGDQFRFPKREVHAAPGAVELPLALDPAAVRAAFADVLPGEALEPSPGRWPLLFERMADRLGAASAAR